MGRGLLFLLLGAAAVPAQETQTLKTEDGVYAVDVPAAWTLTRVPPKDAVFAYEVEAPGVRPGGAELYLYAVEGVLLTARAQANHEVPAQQEIWKTKDARVGLHPLPHLRLDFAEGGRARTAVYAFVRRQCRGLHPCLVCDREDLPRLEADFLAAAATVRTTHARWPGVARDYDRSEKDGLVFLAHPSVPARDVRRVQKAVAAVQKEFVRHHGKIERPEDEPCLVYVHAKREDAKELSKDARLSSYGHHADVYARRLFAVVFEKEGDHAHLDLVRQAATLFFVEACGSIEPLWALVGEREAFFQEALTGKRLPYVAESFHRDFGGITATLDELDALQEKDPAAWMRQATGYVIFFRTGPSKYRKVYEDFLRHVQVSGDPKDARRQLLAFHPGELRDEAERHLRARLKPVSR